MGKWLDRVVERKESKDKNSGDIPKNNTDNTDTMAVPPIQVNQAAQDYRRYGYIRIFSTVLGKAVYLAQDERAAKGVPDDSIPVFLESDIQAEEAKVLLEAMILFGGSIKRVEDCRELPSSEQ